MKVLQLIFMLSFFLTLVACNTEQIAPVIDNLNIELAVEPDPPTAGDATLIITVKDVDGTSINDATVVVHGDMDHEGMIPVDGESVSGQNGMYHVPFEWMMGGGWILDVTVTLPDNAGIATNRFELNVGAISKDSIVNQGNDDTSAMDNDTSPINIHYMPDNDPALAGDANIVVMLTTTDGQPIDDASVSLHADMQAHEMMSITGTSGEGIKGRYTVPVRWTMAGEWEVDIFITLSDAQEITRTYAQQVVTPNESEDEIAGMSDHSD